MINRIQERIRRGEVIDLAVAIAVGLAFTSLVTALVGDLFMPVLNVLLGAATKGQGVTIELSETQSIDVSGAIQALIVFAITAAAASIALGIPLRRRRTASRQPSAPDATPQPTPAPAPTAAPPGRPASGGNQDYAGYFRPESGREHLTATSPGQAVSPAAVNDHDVVDVRAGNPADS